MHVTWNDAKSRVKSVNQRLYEIIEDINPSAEFTLNLVDYHYGEIISDDKSFYTTDKDGMKIKKSSEDFPLALVIDKRCELFLETSSNIIPWLILQPGDLFPLTKETTHDAGYQFHPGSVLTLVSGLRNVSFLPIYSYAEAFRKLQRHYSLSQGINPASYEDHYKIFSKIAQHENSPWKSTLLYFDSSWRDKIMNDIQWLPFKEYIIEQSSIMNSCKRNIIYLNYAMRDIAHSQNFSHKYYTDDIIKQMLFIAVSEFPGYKPALDEKGLPSKLIYDSITSISNNISTPIIMEPCLLSNPDSNNDLYLSITQNTVSIADKKTFKPINYLSEIDMYFNLFLNHLKDNTLTKNTVYGKLANKIHIDLFSERGSSSENIHKAKELISYDERIKLLFDQYSSVVKFGLPERSPFLKAFVKISGKV